MLLDEQEIVDGVDGSRSYSCDPLATEAVRST